MTLAPRHCLAKFEVKPPTWGMVPAATCRRPARHERKDPEASLSVRSPWRLMIPNLIDYVVIPTEEQYLERRFGAEYLDYKASFRRWL
jgi:protein-S-isoprenylcysteine O-methyltransferase Ste14